MRSVVLFFVAALALTALCQAPGILAFRAGAMPAGLALPLMAVGSAGPTLVAIALCAWAGGRAGVRDLFRRRGNPGKTLYAIALLHPVCAHLLGSAALLAAGHYTAHHLLYPPLRPDQVAIAILAPLGEEYGWRGYALPRLQSVMSPLWASVLIAWVWWLWHVPTFFLPGATRLDALLLGVLLLAGSVIYTWLYNTSGRSMRLPLLAHLGIHLDNVFRAAAAGDGYGPLYATAAVLLAFAIGLVATGRLSRATTAPTG